MLKAYPHRAWVHVALRPAHFSRGDWRASLFFRSALEMRASRMALAGYAGCNTHSGGACGNGWRRVDTPLSAPRRERRPVLGGHPGLVTAILTGAALARKLAGLFTTLTAGSHFRLSSMWPQPARGGVILAAPPRASHRYLCAGLPLRRALGWRSAAGLQVIARLLVWLGWRAVIATYGVGLESREFTYYPLATGLRHRSNRVMEPATRALTGSHNPAPHPARFAFDPRSDAHGAKSVSYFCWRKLPFAQEQMHSGLNLPIGT